MLWIVLLLCCIYIVICILYAWFEGKKKATGFIGSLLLLICIPFICYWVIELLTNKKAKDCAWCGNKYNEAVYCGLCGKNENAEIRPGFVKRSNS